MKVSVNTLKQYTDITISTDKLVEIINARLGGVEEVIDLSAKYRDVYVVRVASVEKHPDADKLTICKIDDSRKVADLERDEDGYVTVVCGAPNVRAGMFTTWLPPKATVPSTYSDDKPFILDARKLRGVLSNGMLAAGDELDINNDHDGIVEIDPEEWIPGEKTIRPGVSFADLYGLNTQIIDIENKMFTHRPDCFGQLGVAREIAGITHTQFVSPSWYGGDVEYKNTESPQLDIVVTNDIQEKVPRFMAAVMSNVTIKASPLWLQCELAALGVRAINNIVDVTNYIMLLTGQPLHAYDYDSIRGKKIGARMALSGEKVHLLNGKTAELTGDDIVIVDGGGPIGLAGVMGGADSEVSADTKNIVIECATFDMYTIRKTSMRHGLFTDAVTRFTKGQSSLQNPHIIAMAMRSIADVSGAKTASKVQDVSPRNDQLKKVSLPLCFINDRLGLKLSVDEVKKLLEHTEFSVDVAGDSLVVQAPFWRTDIALPEDIVEEVGRLYGFDSLPRELPMRSTKPTVQNANIIVRQLLRSSMKHLGANELLTYSFVHEDLLKKSSQPIEQAFRLSNALSPDLQYYRLTVLPSLLDKVHANIKAGVDEFLLYEIGKGHNKKFHASDDNGLPLEIEFMDMVYSRKKPGNGAPYYKMLATVKKIVRDLGADLVIKPIEDPIDAPVSAPFDQTRSALLETPDGIFVGMVGELKHDVRKSFKLPDYTSAATLDLKGLIEVWKNKKHNYRTLRKYPGTKKDISIVVDRDTSYIEVMRTAMMTMLRIASHETIDANITPVSIYQSSENSDKKTITLRLDVADTEKTITEKQAMRYVKEIEALYN